MFAVISTKNKALVLAYSSVYLGSAEAVHLLEPDETIQAL